MIVTVSYYKVIDMDRARQCPRCDGTGHERVYPDVTCPRCSGSGVHPEGYVYEVPEGLELALGDVVRCPPTPYSGGHSVIATVIDLGGDAFPGKALKTIIERVGAES